MTIGVLKDAGKVEHVTAGVQLNITLMDLGLYILLSLLLNSYFSPQIFYSFPLSKHVPDSIKNKHNSFLTPFFTSLFIFV